MRKKIFCLCTVTLFTSTLILSGCGASNTQSTSSEATTTTTSTGNNSDTSAETSYPYTYQAIDDTGASYEQTIAAVPEKVITNNQSSTELLLELGLGSKIIGTVAKDNETLDHLKEEYDSIPILADKREVSKEKIVGLEPDMVIGRAKSFTDDSFGTIADLNQMGISVYTQEAARMDEPQTLESIIHDVKNIGTIFNIQEKANAYADTLEQRLTAIEEKASTISSDEKKVLVMVNYQDGTFGAYGKNATLQNNILETLHTQNVMDAGANGLSSENLISLNPDVIIYVNGTNNADTDKTAIDSLLNDDVLASVPAIQNKQIITVDYNEFMGYGFQTFDCMETLAKFLYPDIF